MTALCRLALPPLLDGFAVNQLPPPSAHRPGATAILLDASAVRDVDPVGAARLWLWCRKRLAGGSGDIRLVGLDPVLSQRLRNHPLAALQREDEDHLFADCCSDEGPSTR